MLKFFLPVLFFSLHTFAQTDTITRYFDRFERDTSREAAVFYSKIYKSEGLWKKVDYGLSTDSLFRETSFLDSARKTRHGIAKAYYRSGKLRDSIVYENGLRRTSWYFYESGKKQAFANLDFLGRVTAQMGWDEAGNELKDFVVEKEAQFPGGMDGWKRYLERNLNPNVAADDGAPVGNYTVKVQFVVDKDGIVSNVKAISVPPLCPSCGKEAERVIRKGPKWIAAIQNGRPVIYQAIQYLTFFVANR